MKKDCLHKAIRKISELESSQESYLVISDTELESLSNYNSIVIDTTLSITKDTKYIICYGMVFPNDDAVGYMLHDKIMHALDSGALLFRQAENAWNMLVDINIYDSYHEASTGFPFACLIDCNISDCVMETAELPLYLLTNKYGIFSERKPDFEIHLTGQVDYVKNYEALCFTDESGTEHGTYPGLNHLPEIWKQLVSRDDVMNSKIQARILLAKQLLKHTQEEQRPIAYFLEDYLGDSKDKEYKAFRMALDLIVEDGEDISNYMLDDIYAEDSYWDFVFAENTMDRYAQVFEVIVENGNISAAYWDMNTGDNICTPTIAEAIKKEKETNYSIRQDK